MGSISRFTRIPTHPRSGIGEHASGCATFRSSRRGASSDAGLTDSHREARVTEDRPQNTGRNMRYAAALLALVSTAAFGAPPEMVGDWTLGGNAHDQWAASINDSGAIFGKWCGAGVCHWVLSSETSCIDTVKTPAILNGGTGALPVSMYCSGTLWSSGPKFYKWIIDSPDAIDTLVFANEQVGIAAPLGGTLFKVFRFNTKQASPAMQALFRNANEADKKSTRDSTL